MQANQPLHRTQQTQTGKCVHFIISKDECTPSIIGSRNVQTPAQCVCARTWFRVKSVCLAVRRSPSNANRE